MSKNNNVNKLADLIEANPNCQFEIDNDCWYITKDGEEIASSRDFHIDQDWYGDGHTYGAGLAIAMIELLNRRGFKIKSTSV